MKNIAIVLAVVAGLTLGTAQAQGFKEENLYAGGGIGLNSQDHLDDAIGFQFFGGYRFDNVDLGPVNLAVEVGYMTSGDFESNGADVGSADGVWTTAVFDYPLNEQAYALGRTGLDLGDDDGLMIGIGAGYRINPQLDVRGEYVARDNVKSLQANFVYRF